MKKEMMTLAVGLIALVVTMVVALIGLAITEGFKESEQIDNATADLFAAGITVVAGFIGLIALIMVGAVMIGMVKQYLKFGKN